MKKIFFSIAIASLFILGSCAKSACDCKKERDELRKKYFSIHTKPEKKKDLEKEGKELKEACKDFKPEDFKDCK